jgi:glycosyltransferase domain-containing protein
MHNPRLTVILTLKGRYSHTLRWLWHANQTRLPYHILIADGDPQSPVAELVKDKSKFPHLSYEYHSFNDTCYQDYFRKIARAVELTQTPFVRIVDNDDFIFQSGTEKCLDFLQENPAFCCAMGRTGGFGLRPEAGLRKDLVGRLSELNAKYRPRTCAHEFLSEDPLENALKLARQFDSFFYAVFRRETLQTISQEFAAAHFTSTEVWEAFIGLRAVTLGKVKIYKNFVTYMRQYGTSLRAGERIDWVGQMLSANYSKDLDFLLEKISEVLALGDQNLRLEIKNKLRNAYGDQIRAWLKRHYTSLTFKQRLLRKFNHHFKPKASEKVFWSELIQAGMSKEMHLAQGSELKEMMATLNSPPFEEFLKISIQRDG